MCSLSNNLEKLKQYRIYSLTITQLNEKAITKYAENHRDLWKFHNTLTNNLWCQKKTTRVNRKQFALNDKEKQKERQKLQWVQ